MHRNIFLVLYEHNTSPFLFIGLLCGVWCVVWIIFVRDSPEQVKNISEVEKNYILNSLGNTEEVGHSHKVCRLCLDCVST